MRFECDQDVEITKIPNLDFTGKPYDTHCTPFGENYLHMIELDHTVVSIISLFGVNHRADSI